MFTLNFGDFNSLIQLQFKIFKIVGIRFDLSKHRKDSFRVKWANIIYRVFCYTVYFAHILLCVLYVILTEGNLVMKLSTFPNIYAYATAFSKFVFVSKHQERTERILRKLKEFYDQQEPSKMVQREKFIGKVKFFRSFMLGFMIIPPIIFILPLIATYSRYLRLGTWSQRYLSVFWCPFISDDYYVPVYFLVYYSFVIMILNMTAADALLFIIVTSISQQLKELSREFNNLKSHGCKIATLVDRHVVLFE